MRKRAPSGSCRSDLLFGEAPAVGFELADATTLSNGVVVLSYQTDKTLERAA